MTPTTPPSPPSPSRYPFHKRTPNTLDQGIHAFSYLIHPLPYSQFFSTYFEKLPLFLPGAPSKFRSLPKIVNIEHAVRSTHLQPDTVDVTSYTETTARETHPQSTVNATTWDAYKNGCSIRLRRPQPYFNSIYLLCHHLEAFLQCVVGANIYLTPPESQGFAPHFDDVDVFICQLQGKKVWKVYQKRMDGHDTLPRKSSIDFEQSDLTPVELEQELTAGDVLYLPRGYVHQAVCTDEASLHVTISMCQRWTWADFLLQTFQMGIESAANRNCALRTALPLRFGSYVGISAEAGNKHRDAFSRMTGEMIARVAREYPVDMAADAMMKGFMDGRLPPVGEPERGVVSRKTRVRLVEGDVVRVTEGGDGMPVLWCSRGNSKFGGKEKEKEKEKVTCTAQEAGALIDLQRRFPESMKVAEMELEGNEVELVEGLLEIGIVEVVHE